MKIIATLLHPFLIWLEQLCGVIYASDPEALSSWLANPGYLDLVKCAITRIIICQ
jgi:hypothetical protein